MKTSILDDVLKELKRAKRKFPSWPDHPAAQAGIVAEEAGELMKAALQYKYERAESAEGIEKQRQHMRLEAIQTAAVALRFLENL
jgi:NTP pyrophosphatase (non-canonical NTP hydrolase)